MVECPGCGGYDLIVNPEFGDDWACCRDCGEVFNMFDDPEKNNPDKSSPSNQLFPPDGSMKVQMKQAPLPGFDAPEFWATVWHWDIGG